MSSHLQTNEQFWCSCARKFLLMFCVFSFPSVIVVVLWKSAKAKISPSIVLSLHVTPDCQPEINNENIKFGRSSFATSCHSNNYSKYHHKIQWNPNETQPTLDQFESCVSALYFVCVSGSKENKSSVIVSSKGEKEEKKIRAAHMEKGLKAKEICNSL